MQFVKNAIPQETWPGIDFSKEKVIVLPDDSLSLEEILDRFTRKESLPIGLDMEYGEDESDNPLNIDLEKMANADLVDKELYLKALYEVSARFKRQEQEKAEAEANAKTEAEKAEVEKRIAEAVAKSKSGSA